jgi:pyridoxine 4-dehydrogenase
VLRRAGRLGRDHLAQAQAIAPVVCVQNPYALDSRSPHSEDLLRICGEQDIAFVPFYAIAGKGRDSAASGTDR